MIDDDLRIGIIGAPNKGKSTLFSALTMNDVGIADYPFTTIDPNLGIAYVTAKCADSSLNVKCNPRNSKCTKGIRSIPVNVIDVAGLVEGAHTGRGRGNKFLNDLASADAFILVIDISGKTNKNGEPCEGCDPLEDIKMVKKELAEWVAAIIMKHTRKILKSKDHIRELDDILSGLKITKYQIADAVKAVKLPSSARDWNQNLIFELSMNIIENSKPIFICANKYDINGAENNLEKVKSSLDGNVMFCSAAIELALKKAETNGIISYFSGEDDFDIIDDNIDERQKQALEYIKKFLKKNGTNVQEMINKVVFKIMNQIVVYAVEDENKYSDHYGQILPDAILMEKGSTIYDMAMVIHTDLARGLLYAVDAKTKMRLGKDYILKEGDVIRIVSAIGK